MIEKTFEFEIQGNRFLGTRLPAVEQAKMLKRVMPLFPPLVPFILQLDGDPFNIDVAKVMQLAQPLTEALSKLDDDDFTWLIQTSATSVKIMQDDSWRIFWAKGAQQGQFDDLNDLSILLPITVRCIQENLARFFSVAVTSLPRPVTTKP